MKARSYVVIGMVVAAVLMVKYFGGRGVESDKDVCGIDTEGIVWEAPPPMTKPARRTSPFQAPRKVNVRHVYQRTRIASLELERAFPRLELGMQEREAAKVLGRSPEVTETETGKVWRFHLAYNMGGEVEDKLIEVVFEDGRVVDKSCRFTDPEGVLKRRLEKSDR